MGVVSGVVMAYEFGTNRSGFSNVAGNVTGPLLTYEGLTAFFLEAGFLGVMLFGWQRVGPRAHFFATLMVALGTLVAGAAPRAIAFRPAMRVWIAAAMHEIAGFLQETNGVTAPDRIGQHQRNQVVRAALDEPLRIYARSARPSRRACGVSSLAQSHARRVQTSSRRRGVRHSRDP